MRRPIRCTRVFVWPLLVAAFADAPADAQHSPESALTAFQLAPELRIELAASEPLVASPCAIAFDERGRLFVAENRGYPSSASPPLGRVAMLEDTDGDGRMDKRFVVAEGLTFPNGVLPWNGGAFVTCAPDILFLKDTDGDGRADERRVVLTGFDTSGSTQLRANSPIVGPDGWIWIATGLRGGRITSPDHPEYPALTLKSDLRFHPSTGQFEAVDGRSQYGHSFDEFGRRFICMNRIQVQHVVLPSRYLKRNPRLAFSDTVQNCPELVPNPLLQGGGGAARIYPISKNLTTADSHAGTFTAACGVHVWCGAGLPQEYRGSAFSCDPTGNLVHVDKLVPRGATFAAVPLLNEREFLASTDDWFRPVFLAEGPDGALYVCDMYRKVIEHPEYLPEEIRKRTDFESGREMGRIWRIRGKEEQPLIPKSEAQFLRKLDREGKLDDKQLEEGLKDEDPRVREVALQLAEPRLANARALVDETIRSATDPDARVRFHCALALGSINEERAAEALATIAARDLADRWTRAAVLSSIVGSRVPGFLKAFVAKAQTFSAEGIDFLIECGGLLTEVPFPKDNKPEKFAVTIDVLTARFEADHAMAILTGWSERSATRLNFGSRELERVVAAATETLRAPDISPQHRALAVRFLARTNRVRAEELLLSIATSNPSEDLQRVAISRLEAALLIKVARMLFASDRWQSLSPRIRETLLSSLLSQPGATGELLAALETGLVARNAIDPTRRQQLLKHKDPSLRERAAKLFGANPGDDRMTAFENTKTVLQLKASGINGRTVFQRACATCHRLDREGYGVGPDLFGIRSQPKESILLHIIVPEHEIAPGFAGYLAETKDGRTLSGIIISETDESITVRQALAVDERILRRDIASLTASPLSFMPAGLEQTMTPQELADLLAYLKGEGP